MLATLTTSTTLVNLHRGAVLPAARVVVIVIPTLAGLFYWYFVARRRRG
jgi:hypothetical protein